MSSPTLLAVIRSVNTSIASPQQDGNDSGYGRSGDSEFGCNEIISLIGVLIAFLTGVAGLISWRYKRRCARSQLQSANLETDVENSPPEDVHDQTSRTMPNGYTVNSWTQAPHQLATPETAITPSGGATEMKDLEEGHQNRTHAEPRGFTIPERAVGRT